MTSSFFWTILMTPLVLSCHHGFQYHNQRSRARARAALLHGNVNRNNLSSVEFQQMGDYDLCDGQQYTPYSSIEMRSTAVLQPFQSEAELAVAEGGRLTCSFDNPYEYCSWHAVRGGGLKVYRGHHEIPFDRLRFECTTQRMFNFDGGFLLAGGENVPGENGVAIETEIQCLYDDSIVKFDIWSNSDNVAARFCLIDQVGNMDCEDVMASSNPVNISIPKSMDPFRLRLEVGNLDMENIVLVDNIYFEGRICELIPDDKDIDAKIRTTSIAASEELAVLVEPSKNEIVPFEVELTTAIQTSTTTVTITATDATNVTTHLTDELTACEALTCNFNEDNSCFYGLSGIGSTSPWLTSHKLVGNRHTGVQRINLNDPSAVGFVYVGENVNEKHYMDTYVMESPKFTLSTNILLVFDVYIRSKGPTLKVCLDSFDYCIYRSPDVSPKFFWKPNEKLFIPPGVRKVYFLAENVRGNQFIGLDNIRVEAEDGSVICDS